MSTFFGLIDDLLAEITSPALEKSRSAGTDEQLMHRYFFTIGIRIVAAYSSTRQEDIAFLIRLADQGMFAALS